MDVGINSLKAQFYENVNCIPDKLFNLSDRISSFTYISLCKYITAYKSRVGIIFYCIVLEPFCTR